MFVSRAEYRKQQADLESLISKYRMLEQENEHLRTEISKLKENANYQATEIDVAQKLRAAICKAADKMTEGGMGWYGSNCTSTDVTALVAAYTAFEHHTCRVTRIEGAVSE